MMQMRERADADAYLEFIRSGAEPMIGSAWETVQDAVDREPDRAWRVLLWAVALARDPAELAFIGTGPLETLLVNHQEYVDSALKLAQRHDNFREAFRSSDIRGGAPEDVTRVTRFFVDGMTSKRDT